MVNILLQLAKFGYIAFIIVIAIVLAYKSINDIGMAAIYSIGSFVALAILGYFIFKKMEDHQ
jgi:uncharacterized membrane protein